MVVLGRVVAPFGVHGWLKIHPFGDDPLSWRAMPQWWLGRDPDRDEGWTAYGLKACRAHGAGLIVQLEGVPDRSAAEALEGLYVGAPRAALPATGRDEYYWADLVGLQVVNLQGEPLGVVEELISTGAHEVLSLRDDENIRRLLPFVAQVVKSVDLGERRIQVDWGRDWGLE